MTTKRAVFWTLFAATLIVYATMLLWSLPFLSGAANGLIPFDLRPTGYDLSEAKAFLAALPPDAVAFYLGVQHLLDTIYPALLAATLFFAILALAPRRIGGWRWLLASTAVPGAVFDWLENAAVAAMLRAGPDGLTPQMVSAANRWTLLKSAFTTLAMAIAAILLIVWFIARCRRSAGKGTGAT